MACNLQEDKRQLHSGEMATDWQYGAALMGDIICLKRPGKVAE